MTSILVVDDHGLMRMGIIRMLEDREEFTVIGEAASGEESLHLVPQLKPDVVLMDLKMPGMGGVEATRKLLASHPGLKIIIVTGLVDHFHPPHLIKAGAMGYVTKTGGLQEVVNAIHAALRGRQYFSSNIAQQLALRNCHADPYASPFDCLSQRELQTTMLIIHGKRPQEIASIFSVSNKTVNTYRYRIFEKLGINSDVELTLLAVKYNIVSPEIKC